MNSLYNDLESANMSEMFGTTFTEVYSGESHLNGNMATTNSICYHREAVVPRAQVCTLSRGIENPQTEVFSAVKTDTISQQEEWTEEDSMNLKWSLDLYYRMELGILPKVKEYTKMEPVLQALDQSATEAYKTRKRYEYSLDPDTLASENSYRCIECASSKPRKGVVLVTSQNAISHRKTHIRCNTCNGWHGMRGFKHQASRYMRWCCEHHCFSPQYSTHGDIFSKLAPVCCMHGIQCTRKTPDCCSKHCIHLSLLWSCCHHGAACTYYQPQLPVGIYYEDEGAGSMITRRLDCSKPLLGSY